VVGEENDRLTRGELGESAANELLDLRNVTVDAGVRGQRDRSLAWRRMVVAVQTT
jgi:hypothetical protein